MSRLRAVLGSEPTRAGCERWLVWALVAGAVFLLGLTPIADGDIFWHLAAGREMVRRRAWLYSDTFTVSAAGRPWTDVHWLFQLGAYAIHRVGGLRALVLVKAGVLAAGAVIATETAARSASGRPPGLARVLCGGALVGALALCRHLLPVRPTIVTLVMLAIFVAILESSRRRGDHPWRLLGWLPALQIVWNNCQGLSILGPIVIATYVLPAAASRWRPRWRGVRLRSSEPPRTEENAFPLRAAAVVLALCLLAALATPYGLSAIGLPARLVLRLIPAPGNVFSTEVAENVSPLRLGGTAPADVAYFRAYLVALLAGLVYARRQLRVSHGLLVASFGTLALMATRNIPLFYWVATPLVGGAVARQIELATSWRRLGRGVARVLGASVTIAALAFAAFAASREPSIAVPAPFHFPIESAALLSRSGASGPIFAPDHHGGYLEFVAPRLQPYLDTRLVLHTAEEYASYLDVVDRPAGFEALAERARFGYVVLTTAYPDRYLELAQHLAHHPRWRLIFTDGSEVLFARVGTGGGGDAPALVFGERSTTDAILGALAQRFRAEPRLWAAARLHLARLQIILGVPREALYVLSTLDDPAALQLRARAYLVAGETAAAAGLASIMLAHDPHDIRSLVLLAQTRLAAGDTPTALRWLAEALAVDPYDAEARAVLAKVERDAPPP